MPLYTHPLATNGVIYLELGFDMGALPARLLPYLPIFSRALTQTGTRDEDFVQLTQRIGRSTGGVGVQRWSSARRDGDGTAAWLFVRGKAVPEKLDELLAILNDVLTSARFDNRDRIRQMVLEGKAGFESSLAGMGNAVAAQRLRAQFSASDWLGEQTGGVSQYFFLRDLVQKVDSDWPAVEAALRELRDMLLVRAKMVVNVTADEADIDGLRPALAGFLTALPEGSATGPGWSFTPTRASEGLSFPGQVNYVAKGGNIVALGLEPTGGMAVAIKHLNTTYMWDKIRVQGGAYGGGSSFDPFSGSFAFTSYRDPNLLETIDNYDNAAAFLRQPIGAQDLTRSVIGVIGAVDTYRLPDAKGFTSLLWELMGDSEEERQQRREEILAASQADFTALADGLDRLRANAEVVVLGSEKAIRAANDERGGFLKVTKVF